MLEQPSPEMLLTVGSAAVFISLVAEIVLRAWAPTSDVKDRFGPLLALVIGVVACTASALATGGDPFSGVLTGIIAAGTAMGIHDTASSVTSG